MAGREKVWRRAAGRAMLARAVHCMHGPLKKGVAEVGSAAAGAEAAAGVTVETLLACLPLVPSPPPPRVVGRSRRCLVGRCLSRQHLIRLEELWGSSGGVRKARRWRWRRGTAMAKVWERHR